MLEYSQVISSLVEGAREELLNGEERRDRYKEILSNKRSKIYQHRNEFSEFIDDIHEDIENLCSYKKLFEQIWLELTYTESIEGIEGIEERETIYLNIEDIEDIEDIEERETIYFDNEDAAWTRECIEENCRDEDTPENESEA
ncbi:hypothetical protein HC928_05480 [bacterium]|nr:hypothetical protein [bacterium]